jgi:probable addiction module antidote protein
MKETDKSTITYDEFLVASLHGDEQAQIEFIKANFQDNGDCPATILKAIRLVAEARGFKNFASSAQLNRENLYRVLNEKGNPRLDTFLKILNALGLKLSVTKKERVS